jgi:predicted nucleic acid-binding protein
MMQSALAKVFTSGNSHAIRLSKQFRNTCIGIINNKPAALRQKPFQVAVEQVAIAQMVLYELEYGICRSQQQQQQQQQQRNRDNLNNFLKYIQVLDWGEEQSREAALVTYNVREFGWVQGLLLEDWE